MVAQVGDDLYLSNWRFGKGRHAAGRSTGQALIVYSTGCALPLRPAN
jgi:hypothetical protein